MNCKRRNVLMATVVLACAICAGSVFADDVIIEGVLKSTGGFKFPDGTILSSVGNISGSSSSGAFQVIQTGSGHAIDATSQAGDAVHASGTHTGIYGESLQATGILGFTYASGNSNSGVVGSSQGSANGVWGQSTSGFGVRGSSTSGDGVHGESTSTGTGVYAENSSSGYALWAKSSGTGAAGHFEGNMEVFGAASVNSSAPNGLYVSTSETDGNGISASADNGAQAYGVIGSSSSGYGVVGYASGSAPAAGLFFSSASSGTALIAESPSGTQVMKVDAAGIHAGPGMTSTPLAYGYVDQNGSCSTTRSPNITSCALLNSPGSPVYDITISGEDFDFTKYVAIVTPGYSSPEQAVIPVCGANGVTPSRHLAVVLYNTSSARITRSFNFVVFKP